QGTFNAQANASFNAPFTNAAAGILNRSGSGTSGFGSSFASAGAVNVNAGTMDFTAINSYFNGSGAFTIASGATFQVGNTTNTFNFDTNSSITGAGTFNFIGNATVLVSGSYSVATTSLSGGGGRTLAFLGSAVSFPTLNLTNSTLAGSAALSIASA